MLNLIFYIMSFIIFVILIKWILHNMSSLENKTKIIYIVIGIIVISIMSFVIFNISKNGVQYPNEEVYKEIRKLMLLLFIPMNGLIILPYLASLIEKVKLEEIGKEDIKKRIIIFSIILLLVILFECKYLTNSQLGILAFYHK